MAQITQRRGPAAWTTRRTYDAKTLTARGIVVRAEIDDDDVWQGRAERLDRGGALGGVAADVDRGADRPATQKLGEEEVGSEGNRVAVDVHALLRGVAPGESRRGERGDEHDRQADQDRNPTAHRHVI